VEVNARDNVLIESTYLFIYFTVFFPHHTPSPHTSFFPLLNFLAEGVQTENFIAHVIGDLATIDEAKQFVKSRMDCGNAPSSFFDQTDDGKQIDMWSRVYEVCGGNIGLLERCASHSKRLRSWQKGLEEVSKGPKDAVKRGLGPRAFSRTGGSRSPPAWTREDYKTVLREIVLAKEHKHAVSFDKLQDLVGEDALVSMVEWNLVSVRRKSSWAKDVPEMVFTELDDEKLVTMPSPPRLYFVLKMHEAGKLDAPPPNDDK
jgi:hypothetical protein